MTKNSSKRNAAKWESLVALHKLYVALAQEFSIELSSAAAFEKTEAPSAKSVAATEAWFAEMDGRIGVHQLRQFLQTSPLADEAGLRVALAYTLHKPDRADIDRDKTDFLLVQFFSLCAPSLLEDGEVTFQFVADTLEPVLGSSKLVPLESLEGLNEVIETASACHRLQELFDRGVIERGRKLKLATANQYFEPATLVSFTRFNFLLRRCFFRNMHRDLNAILDGLRTLELRGVEMLDCRGAELSAEEPVGRLRMICQSWKAMFQAEYSFGQPLRMLVDLRAAVDSALAGSSAGDGKNASPTGTPLRAKAAAAAGESSAEAEAGDDQARGRENSGSGENVEL